jgi:catechol 2,3-dioxygenase-like lactoylglutathione lyase family enzyme
MEIRGLHHAAVCVHDLDRARAFYVDALGLTEVHRPDTLPQPGAWLIVAGYPDQMVHLMVTGEDAPESFHHFALTCLDLEGAAAELADHGFDLSAPQPVDGYGRQAFVRDPDGNIIELNEPASS